MTEAHGGNVSVTYTETRSVLQQPWNFLWLFCYNDDSEIKKKPPHIMICVMNGGERIESKLRLHKMRKSGRSNDAGGQRRLLRAYHGGQLRVVSEILPASRQDAGQPDYHVRRRTQVRSLIQVLVLLSRDEYDII